VIVVEEDLKIFGTSNSVVMAAFGANEEVFP
jgi:hypothetical protein